MLREIVTTTGSSYTLQFPKEMLGKTVEIIAFELNETHSEPINKESKELRIKAIEEITKNSLIDLSKFKFNRNDANNYDG